MTVVYAVVNSKGGVGKTTIAINLAAALAARERRVLLIDMDPQCNTTHSFNVGYEYTLYDVLYGRKPLKDIIVPVFPNLDLAPSDPNLDQAAIHLIPKAGREYVLRRAIQALPPRYDYILIDNSPYFSLLTQNSVAAASGLIIPVELEPFAMSGIIHMTEQIYTFCKDIDHTVQIAAILPVKVDRRYAMTENYLESLKRHFKDRVFAPIRTDASIPKAQAYQKTVFDFDPRSKAAEDFLFFAERIDEEAMENA